MTIRVMVGAMWESFVPISRSSPCPFLLILEYIFEVVSPNIPRKWDSLSSKPMLGQH